ncbi:MULTISPECIES: helix-turn-helix domain-containing protein [Catenuloplanes]|uniref:AraC-like DNA-binding protein n=1 Tax=Catenuloplanes niger TaxID=587534 RepID=A0AAE3ZIB6_9ACTN|nr:helix-turn-helix domain-containing protein [Catenuloplanes niger]MDR7320482.1 AraC-like DNA-binding protein [Catenuloplanes niger]
MSDTTAGAFAFDGARAPVSDLGDDWLRHVGDRFAFPHFSAGTLADFRFRMRVARVRDTVSLRLRGATPARTAGPPCRDEEFVRLWIVRSGAVVLGGAREDSLHTVPAGGFLIRHAEPLAHFRFPPGTTADVVILPADALLPLLGGRAVTGSARTAELRLLATHAEMVRRTLPELTPAGVDTAATVLIELARTVVRGAADPADPRLEPTLVRTAKDLARRRLTDPGLTPAALAGDLNVSLRTLQRAFAATGESIMGYVRDQRLAEARAALTAATGRLGVAEAAARYQFADGSHFTRAFKRRYGRTPGDDARQPSE